MASENVKCDDCGEIHDLTGIHMLAGGDDPVSRQQLSSMIVELHQSTGIAFEITMNGLQKRSGKPGIIRDTNLLRACIITAAYFVEKAKAELRALVDSCPIESDKEKLKEKMELIIEKDLELSLDFFANKSKDDLLTKSGKIELTDLGGTELPAAVGEALMKLVASMKPGDGGLTPGDNSGDSALEVAAGEAGARFQSFFDKSKAREKK